VVPIRVAGVEALSPTVPVYPEWVIPLAEILVNETGAVLISEADITDIRPVLQVPGSTLPCGTVLDVMYLPGLEVQLNGFLPAIGTLTIGKVGSGADFEGDIYEPLYNRLKNSAPNTGAEVFSAGNLVVIPDWTERIAIGLNTGDPEINAIGKIAGDFAHQHTVDSHTHGVGSHTHPVPTHTHTIPSQAAVTVSSGPDIDNNLASQFDAGSSLTQHHHDVTIPAHNHGGVTGGSGALVTDPSAGTTDPAAPNTNVVTQKPKVRTVYKIVKY
jgi:hypothetical protein